MRRKAFGLMLCSWLFVSMQSHAAVGDPTDAIWRVQQIDLYLRTGPQYYDCSSLRTKIASILRAVGAASVLVDLSCESQMTNNIWARLQTASPVAATPENVQSATTYDARDELIARVRQTKLPTANDIEVFPAEWRTVSFRAVRGVHLGAGDCELLKRLSQQVFPHLELRVVRQTFVCNGSFRPTLVVEALMPRDA